MTLQHKYEIQNGMIKLPETGKFDINKAAYGNLLSKPKKDLDSMCSEIDKILESLSEERMVGLLKLREEASFKEEMDRVVNDLDPLFTDELALLFAVVSGVPAATRVFLPKKLLIANAFVKLILKGLNQEKEESNATR